MFPSFFPPLKHIKTPLMEDFQLPPEKLPKGQSLHRLPAIGVPSLTVDELFTSPGGKNFSAERNIELTMGYHCITRNRFYTKKNPF